MNNRDFHIAIVTKGRPKLLISCLNSIRQQLKPSAVIIVENGKRKLGKVKYKYKYFYESKMGEAYARNKVLEKIKKGIFSFIDDDCQADKNWVKTIMSRFRQNNLDILLGRSENLLKNNVYACVYQSYYLRWLLENFNNINKFQRLKRNNNFFDTKNIAFRRKSLAGFSFDADILFHSINVDVVAGDKLIKQKNVYFDPKMIVYHRNLDSLKKLIIKNFYQGVADQYILERKKINLRKPPIKYLWVEWLKICRQESNKLTIGQKIIFWLILSIYPIAYKIGRLYENRSYHL